MQKKYQSKRLTFRVFSFKRHRTTVSDSFSGDRHANLFSDPWKAEWNGFTTYHGKAKQKDNIRERLVGHQIIAPRSVSPFWRFVDMQFLGLFCSKNGTLQKTAHLVYFFDSIITCLTAGFHLSLVEKSEFLFSLKSATSINEVRFTKCFSRLFTIFTWKWGIFWQQVPRCHGNESCYL